MDLLTLGDYSGKWVKGVIGDALEVKSDVDSFRGRLDGKTLIMLFMKPSTRTRCSFEAGMYQLGGDAIYLDWRTTNFTKGRLQDEVRCLDRYCDVLMARVSRHREILDIAAAAEVPVVNGLCDRFHPCQALADLMTAYEKTGSYDFHLAYVGDGNNVCNSLILGCCKVGAKVTVATPEGYGPDPEVVDFGLKHGLTLTRDSVEAVEDADIVYTDTWVSMGDEAEKEKRVKDLRGYRVTGELLGDRLFMHCLPAVRGQEVTDEVLDSSNSIVFDQAENRMHAQKAMLLKLLE